MIAGDIRIEIIGPAEKFSVGVQLAESRIKSGENK